MNEAAGLQMARCFYGSPLPNGGKKSPQIYLQSNPFALNCPLAHSLLVMSATGQWGLRAMPLIMGIRNRKRATAGRGHAASPSKSNPTELTNGTPLKKLKEPVMLVWRISVMNYEVGIPRVIITWRQHSRESEAWRHGTSVVAGADPTNEFEWAPPSALQSMLKAYALHD